jgi:hypothetical protein
MVSWSPKASSFKNQKKAKMDGRMDGWTDGWMDGWMDGRMDETKCANGKSGTERL